MSQQYLASARGLLEAPATGEFGNYEFVPIVVVHDQRAPAMASPPFQTRPENLRPPQAAPLQPSRPSFLAIIASI
jgi:hypothetical protein